MTTKNFFLALGNQALREKKHTEAMAYYLQALQTVPNLQNVIVPNIERARQAYRATRHAESRQKVAVCSWELSHNAAGRVYTLARLYETFADAEIIGCHFPKWGREIWQPIRDTAIAKHTFIVEDEARFLEQAIELVVAHPYDIVHLSKPRAPNIFLGILYKLLWNAKVLMDIDDEELAFVGADTPIDVDDYIKTHGALPVLKDLAGQQWTRLAISLAKAFDGVTVSNPALQQRYGGEIIRHARDGKRFISSLQCVIRQSTNCRLAQRFEKLGQYIGSTSLSSLFLINNKHSDYFFSRMQHSTQRINLAKHISLKDVTLIKESGLFDEDWYLKFYPRVRTLQIDPVEHYLWVGARLRHNPSPQFNTVAYLEANPDVSEAGVNPLVHYARSGRREGCRSAPSVLLCAHEVNDIISKVNKNSFRECRLNSRNLIEVFVYASGKTASTSLFESFSNLGFGSIHTHSEEYFEVANKKDKRLKFNLKDLIKFCSENHDQIFVIDVFREPISRKMSAFFQHLTRLPFIKNRLFNSTKDLVSHFENNIEELVILFNDHYLLQSENYYSFEEYYRLGFKPDNINFSWSNKIALQNEGNINFIIVRFDDINDWENIFSDLGFSEFKLIHSNSTNEKDLGQLYKIFKKNFFMDKEKLDKIYLDRHRKYLELFYTGQEFEKQYLKWKEVCRS